jgi:hypothetical protein
MPHIQWCDVTKVCAFKRDLFASDLICLGIETSTATLELDEDMDGWDALVTARPTYLYGIPAVSEWWERVAKPAFATNMTILFSAE